MSDIRRTDRTYAELRTFWRKNGLKKPRRWFRISEIAASRLLLDYRDHFSFLIHTRNPEVVQVFAHQTRAAGQSRVYLETQIRGLALTIREQEPLHGTVVEWNRRTFALLGDSGSGKSTFAAFLMSRGARLVSDDLVVFNFSRWGALVRPSDPLFLKVFPVSARLLPRMKSVGPMNAGTRKQIFRIPSQVGDRRLAACFVLEKDTVVRAARMTPLAAHIAAARNTYSTVWWPRRRLKAQFSRFKRLAATTPFFSLSFPRSFSALEQAAEEIEAALSGLEKDKS